MPLAWVISKMQKMRVAIALHGMKIIIYFNKRHKFYRFSPNRVVHTMGGWQQQTRCLVIPQCPGHVLQERDCPKQSRKIAHFL